MLQISFPCESSPIFSYPLHPFVGCQVEESKEYSATSDVAEDEPIVKATEPVSLTMKRTQVDMVSSMDTDDDVIQMKVKTSIEESEQTDTADRTTLTGTTPATFEGDIKPSESALNTGNALHQVELLWGTRLQHFLTPSDIVRLRMKALTSK